MWENMRTVFEVPDGPQDECPQQCPFTALRNREQPNEGCCMGQRDVDDHGPVEVALLVVPGHGPNGICDDTHFCCVNPYLMSLFVAGNGEFSHQFKWNVCHSVIMEHDKRDVA